MYGLHLHFAPDRPASPSSATRAALQPAPAKPPSPCWLSKHALHASATNPAFPPRYPCRPPACSSQASSTAGGFSQQSTAVAQAVSTAVANICGGGDAQAQANAAAQATAKVGAPHVGLVPGSSWIEGRCRLRPPRRPVYLSLPLPTSTAHLPPPPTCRYRPPAATAHPSIRACRPLPRRLLLPPHPSSLPLAALVAPQPPELVRSWWADAG